MWINFAGCLRCTIRISSILFLFVIFIGLQRVYAEETAALDKIIIKVSPDEKHTEGINYLSNEDLQDLPINSYLESFNYLAGVDLQARNSNNVQADLAIRGGNFQQNLVMFNGIRINDPQTAHFNLDIPLTIYDIESIETISATTPNFASQDAISGAINITPKKAAEDKFITEILGGSGHTRGGSFSLSRLIGNFGTRISYDRKKSDGFQYDTDFDTQDVTNVSNFNFGENEVNLFLGMQNKKFGAYDFYTPYRGYNSYEETSARLVNMDARLEYKDVVIKPKIYYRRHNDKFILLRDRPQVYTNHHRSDMYGINLEADFSLGKLGDFIGGCEFGHDKIDSTNLMEHYYSHKSFYISDEIDLNERLTLTLGNRGDMFTQYDPQNSPYFNLNYEIDNKTNAYFSFKRNFRIPTFTELYYSDSTTAGSQGLAPENTLNYELGLDKTFNNLDMGAKIFYRDQHKTIDWTKQAVSDTKWIARNLPDIGVNGIDAYFKLKPNQSSSLRFNYTYLDWRLSDKLGFLPKYGNVWLKHHFILGYDYDLPFGTQAIEFIYKKHAGRNNWFLTNILLNYNINKNSSIFFRVENLFNVGYEEIPGVPSPGRWIESGIKVNF